MTAAPLTDWHHLERLASQPSVDVQEVCTLVSRLFRVEEHEVGLLRVRGRSLEFIYPMELKTAGTIPLSSSAVAARTATTKQSGIFNDFTRVTHHSVFELVPLGGVQHQDFNPQRIQKLLSAAIALPDGATLGVIQISRKGATLESAGPDFSESDLLQLEAVAQYLAPLYPKL